MDQKDLKAIIEQVLSEMNISGGAAASTVQAEPICCEHTTVEDGCIPDVTEVDIRTQYLVKNPAHGEEYAELKAHAPCRLGIGKAGARYKTDPQLQFRAAHSAAQDAVFNDVDHDFVENKMGLFIVQTQCDSKDVYLTRPDLGRKLSEEARKTILEKCKKSPRVQIYVADGLSSAAVADHLNAKRTVVLNLESTSKDIARRLIDFLSGVAYANNGQIKRVAASTFIITPYNVDIMGDLLDELESSGVFF